MKRRRTRARYGPVDPEIGLITHWLFDELPEAEARAVETRLIEDDAFLEKASPLILLFGIEGPVQDEFKRALLDMPKWPVHR